ncbi:hypothetical protein FRC10_009276 [Ceratobasidium sp. 414]|nr:hypothetical protein FRC10_009276 [Ceratobasidium sp. 414]
MDLDKFLSEIAGAEHTPDLTDLGRAIKKIQRASRMLDKRKEQAAMRFEAALARVATQLGGGQHVQKCDALAKGRPWSLRYDLRTLFSQVLLWQQPFAGRSISCEVVGVGREIKSINEILSTFEQGFLSGEGIPGREWYRHLGVAPGRWRGYGATTFPALNEAITLDKNSTLAAHEAYRLTQLLENLAKRLA